MYAIRSYYVTSSPSPITNASMNSAMGSGAAGGGLFTTGAGPDEPPRITSYNVCYTKLLRNCARDPPTGPHLVAAGWHAPPRQSFSCSTTSRGSLGIAALEDTKHFEASLAHNAKWLPWLTNALGGMGITAHPSVGNFVLAQFRNNFV